MGYHSIDLNGATANDKVYCTMWHSCWVEYPKELSEEQVFDLMEKHPLLLEFLEYDDGCGELEDGTYGAVSLGLTSDEVPFSQFDEDHEFDCRDFDNFKSDSDWDGEDKTIVVDGHTFKILLGDVSYVNINYTEGEE